MSDEKMKAADEKFCTDCGAVIKLKAEICPKCGVRQSVPNDNTMLLGSKNADNGKNKMLAAILAITVGAFGVHKFYLGKTLHGVLMLLALFSFILSWLPFIIALVDTAILVSMKDSDFNDKYGHTS